MDLDEVVVDQELSEDLADSRLQSEDSLLGSGPEVDDSVVESGLHLDDGSLFLFMLALLLLWLFLFGLLLLGGLIFLVGVELVVVDLATGVGDLQRQSVAGAIDDVEPENLELDLLSAALDGLSGFGHFADDIDDAFARHVGHVCDHLLRSLLRFEGAGLQRVEVLSEYDEAVVALASDVVNSGSYQYFLSLEGLVDLG